MNQKTKAKVRKWLYFVQKRKCFYCEQITHLPNIIREDDKPVLLATLDHVISLKRGGEDKIYNMVLACMPCNVAKGCFDGPRMKIPTLANKVADL